MAKRPRKKLPANTTRKVVARRGRSEPGTVKAKAGGGRSKCGAANRPPKSDSSKKRIDKRGTPKGKGTVETKGGGQIGNPPYIPTPENCIRVEAMVAAGAEHWFIAEDLGISEDTLGRHHRPQLDHGKKRVDWKVGGSIAQKALAGDPDFEKFYAARRAGWKSTTAVEASGPDGGPIEYRGLSDEELDARIAKLTSNAAAVAKD